MKRYSKAVVMFIVTGILLSSGLSARADNPGALEIQTGVIYDTGEAVVEEYSFIGHELIPDLFLERTIILEKRVQQHRERQLDRARNQSFQSENAMRTEVDTRQVISKLFDDQFAGSVPARGGHWQETRQDFQLPMWLQILIIAGVLSGAVVLGIVLGKRFAGFFRKKEI